MKLYKELHKNIQTHIGHPFHDKITLDQVEDMVAKLEIPKMTLRNWEKGSEIGSRYIKIFDDLYRREKLGERPRKVLTNEEALAKLEACKTRLGSWKALTKYGLLQKSIERWRLKKDKIGRIYRLYIDIIHEEVMELVLPDIKRRQIRSLIKPAPENADHNPISSWDIQPDQTKHPIKDDDEIRFN